MANKKIHTPILVFLVAIATLFAIDYQTETAGARSFFLTSIIQDLISPETITTEILQKTSLKDAEIISEDELATFFDPYLELPENISSRRYGFENSSIKVTEVKSQNPTKIIESLLGQESPAYQFNKINSHTFYLNQIPAAKKTHNFLGIVINKRLYGFQYLPKEHQKILEIIDALQQNE